MKLHTPDAIRIGKIAAASSKAARRLAVPPYCKPARLPYGTPGKSTIALPKPRRFNKDPNQ